MRNKIHVLPALIEDLLPLPGFVGMWVINAVVAFLAELRGFGRSLFSRQFEPIVMSAFEMLGSFIRFQLQFVITIAALLLNALSSLINNVFRFGEERKLSDVEITHLQRIFGQSLNYDAIRIQTGGVKERLGVSPQAVCNDIFLRQQWRGPIFNADKTLTKNGLRLLSHEAAHVWQFQTGGAGYIGDALMTQVMDIVSRRLKFKLSDGYNLNAALGTGRRFDECNVEQQGVLAELVGASLVHANRVDKDVFNQVSGYRLSDAQYQMVLEGCNKFKQSDVRTCLQSL